MSTNSFASKHIVHVVGTRPQFPKVAPVWRALQGKCKQTVIHTGQHYGDAMSKQIIKDVGAHIDLTMNRFPTDLERQACLALSLDREKADLVMVYGDCNATMDGATAANAASVPLAHVEAGLRCGDVNMKEERIRRMVDLMSDILYAPSIDAVYNLGTEKKPYERIQFVGNVMADTRKLVRPTVAPVWRTDSAPFGLVTMHRPENVDNTAFMHHFMRALAQCKCHFVFPKHPRVVLPTVPYNVQVVEPKGYKEFMSYMIASTFVVTDSGGLQEETTLENKPCLTMRPSTERPITITEGTNELTTTETLADQVDTILAGKWKFGNIPLYWDGHAAERIACHLQKYLS